MTRNEPQKLYQHGFMAIEIANPQGDEKIIRKSDFFKGGIQGESGRGGPVTHRLHA